MFGSFDLFANAIRVYVQSIRLDITENRCRAHMFYDVHRRTECQRRSDDGIAHSNSERKE